MKYLRVACVPALVLVTTNLLSCGTSPDPVVYESGSDAGHADVALEGNVLVDANNAPEVSLFDVVSTKDSAPPTGKTLVYAHNDTTLYSVDPEDPKLALVKLGVFDCVGGEGGPGADSSMTDIAVDKDGKLFGVSNSAVYLDMKVADGKVECKGRKVSLGSGTGSQGYFYGLTFAPPTASLGSSEVLIGADSNGDLYLIDRETGQAAIVGRFGTVPANDGQGHNYPQAHRNKTWELSGDIVFLTNQGGNPVGFATLRDCPTPPESRDCSRVDTLAEIDISLLEFVPKGGSVPVVTKAIRGMVLPSGCTKEDCGFGSMYGIAAWKNRVYGFSRTGSTLLIDNATGEGTEIGTPLIAPSNGFAGAGVTTLAPVVAPPPK